MDEERRDVGHSTREWVISAETVPELNAFGIRFCGISYCRRGFNFNRPNPAIRQLLACTSGSGEVLLDGKWHPCEAGMCYATTHGVRHAYRCLIDEPWHLVWVMYNKPESAADKPLAGVEDNALVACDPNLLELAVQGLYKQSTRASNAHLLGLWAELVHLHACDLVTALRGDPRLQRVWHQVDGEPSRRWTLSELADIACMSKEHFRRICLLELKTTPMQYVLRLRLRCAARQLMCSDSKIATIATNCGFGSTDGFSVAFRKEFHITPGAYRVQKSEDRTQQEVASCQLIRGTPKVR
ncbi:MAG: AraC family transcriptional regulator [Verrucomicrobiota bacterium]|nr:AraC family transcriptional regulator [Verrucomicrobiota bacterium]